MTGQPPGGSMREASAALKAVLDEATAGPYDVVHDDARQRWLIVAPDPDDIISNIIVADTGPGEQGRRNAKALASAAASCPGLLAARLRRADSSAEPLDLDALEARSGFERNALGRPLDLDAVAERADRSRRDANQRRLDTEISCIDVPALIVEVRRLRAENERLSHLNETAEAMLCGLPDPEEGGS